MKIHIQYNNKQIHDHYTKMSLLNHSNDELEEISEMIWLLYR